MKLLFKQRFLSWLDSYDIYNEQGEVIYTVEGQLSWGHRLHINNSKGQHIATVKQVMFSFMPTFELFVMGESIGYIKKEFKMFSPSYYLEYKGWHINGEFFEWDYEITDNNNHLVATASKELFNWTDTYVIDVENKDDAIYALMIVLSIDAEKCSRN